MFTRANPMNLGGAMPVISDAVETFKRIIARRRCRR
jgi:hypothetical protein